MIGSPVAMIVLANFGRELGCGLRMAGLGGVVGVIQAQADDLGRARHRRAELYRLQLERGGPPSTDIKCRPWRERGREAGDLRRPSHPETPLSEQRHHVGGQIDRASRLLHGIAA